MSERHYVPAWQRDLIPNRMDLALRFLYVNGILTATEHTECQQRVKAYAEREYREVPPAERTLGERIAEVLPERIMAPYLKDGGRDA